MIECVLGICCILEWGVWNTAESWKNYYFVKSNAFGAGWFNVGGVLLHYLPNAILAFFTGWLIEWNVGSLNMVFVWFWGYFFGVGIMAATNGGFLTAGRGWGFSLQLYHWFNIASGSVFLRFWWFSENRNKQLTFKQILWWIVGIFILLCGGWIANFGILSLAYLASITVGYDFDKLAHYTHNIIMLYGYAGVVFLWLLLRWQFSYCGIKYDISSTVHGIKIIWIRGMYCAQSNKTFLVITTAIVTVTVLSICCGLLTTLDVGHDVRTKVTHNIVRTILN